MKSDERPNFLVIMSDQHRRSAMGCMGDALAVTPTMDRLAERGVVFENFYSNSPLCLPARMSFLTSRHPHEIECWGNCDSLGSDVPTFAHALGAAGYETALCGRMHIVGPDQHHGFEHRLVGDFRATWLWGGWDLESVLGPLADTPGTNRASMEKSGPGWTGYMTYDERVRDAAVTWASQRSARSEDRRPFCFVAGFLSPHCPFVCPRDTFDKHFSTMSPPAIPEGHLETLHPLHRAMRRRSRIEDLTPMEIRRTRAAYYGLLEWYDALMGSLLQSFEDAGLLENTVILYTSDHGDQIGDHGLWWKSTFYEGSTGVPLVVSWPRHLPEGRRVHANASLIDIGPTLTDMAGASLLPKASGQSLLPLLRGDDSDCQDTVLCEFYQPPQRMLRKGPWKFCLYEGYDPQLFNLEEDPGEFHDRAGDPECREVLNAMTQELLENWSPSKVKSGVERREQQRAFLQDWAKAVRPFDPYGWPRQGEVQPVNRIEPCPEAEQPGVPFPGLSCPDGP